MPPLSESEGTKACIFEALHLCCCWTGHDDDDAAFLMTMLQGMGTCTPDRPLRARRPRCALTRCQVKRTTSCSEGEARPGGTESWGQFWCVYIQEEWGAPCMCSLLHWWSRCLLGCCRPGRPLRISPRIVHQHRAAPHVYHI
ncbi:hypothetical protein BS78_09G132800 [Paspalum vaginatum]|nr:hypothetical protein BS78_09G132800 [Paspalum vaginatum]